MRIVNLPRPESGHPDIAISGLHLRIVGFGEQTIVPVADIVATLGALPPHHLVGLRDILYAPYWTATPTCPTRPPHLAGLPQAEYIQAERRIAVYTISAPELFRHVLLHEVGHHVFFITLNSTVKKRWVTEVCRGAASISAYGATSAAEDFAESYAFFAYAPERLQQFGSRHAFMRDWVFPDRPGTRKERNDSGSVAP